MPSAATSVCATSAKASESHPLTIPRFASAFPHRAQHGVARCPPLWVRSARGLPENSTRGYRQSVDRRSVKRRAKIPHEPLFTNKFEGYRCLLPGSRKSVTQPAPSMAMAVPGPKLADTSRQHPWVKRCAGPSDRGICRDAYTQPFRLGWYVSAPLALRMAA
jgi:hypothetical protein